MKSKELKQTLFMKSRVVIIIFLLTLISCQVDSQKQEKKSINKDRIAIPFQYENYKTIIIDAILDDSIVQKICFDTGGKGLLVSERLRETLNSPMKMLLGKSYNSIFDCKIDFLPESHPFFEIWGEKFAIIGLCSFEEKVIEVSFKNKQISLFDNISEIDELLGFQKIRMIRVDDGIKFKLQSEIYIQGKSVIVNLMLDTGYNGAISLNREFMSFFCLDTKKTIKGNSFTTSGSSKFVTSYADSIKIDNIITVVNQKIQLTEETFPLADGLIGTAILDNFTLVIDVKNSELYLKRKPMVKYVFSPSHGCFIFASKKHHVKLSQL